VLQVHRVELLLGIFEELLPSAPLFLVGLYPPHLPLFDPWELKVFCILRLLFFLFEVADPALERLSTAGSFRLLRVRAVLVLVLPPQLFIGLLDHFLDLEDQILTLGDH